MQWMSDTVCNPVTKFLSSLGPSVTFTLAVGEARTGGAQINVMALGAQRPACVLEPGPCMHGVISEAPFPLIARTHARTHCPADPHSHIAEEEGPAVPALEQLTNHVLMISDMGPAIAARVNLLA